MKKISGTLLKKLHKPTKGQSLVEMAVILPILIFMLIGVFEVGWVLRGYLILVNANREIARFAIRPGYLNFAQKDPEVVGYNEVLTHTYTALSGQLPEDFGTNGAMIISHMVIDTGRPCDPALPVEDCECNKFVEDDPAFDPNYGFPLDDLILYPGVPGFEYYTRVFSTTNLTATTNISYVAEAERLTHQNNFFNCELLKKGGLPSANNFIVTELFYKQPQLFGFPLISNPLTDPVSLYTHTTTRLITGARSGESVDTIGPVCTAHPWVVTQDTLNNPSPPNIDDPRDVFDGWVKWDAGDSSDPNTLLQNQIRFPRMAINSYKEPGTSDYSFLVTGKTVASLSGADTASYQATIASLEGLEIIVPVVASGSTPYQIVDFIKVVIPAGGVNLAGGEINALYKGSVATGAPTDHCLVSVP